MGRPLFSKATNSRDPIVRVVEPEKTIPQQSVYTRWTYSNAFDPDADEFFESDDAVFEAFIDPSQLHRTFSERRGLDDEEIVGSLDGKPYLVFPTLRLAETLSKILHSFCRLLLGNIAHACS